MHSLHLALRPVRAILRLNNEEKSCASAFAEFGLPELGIFRCIPEGDAGTWLCRGQDPGDRMDDVAPRRSDPVTRDERCRSHRAASVGRSGSGTRSGRVTALMGWMRAPFCKGQTPIAGGQVPPYRPSNSTRKLQHYRGPPNILFNGTRRRRASVIGWRRGAGYPFVRRPEGDKTDASYPYRNRCFRPSIRRIHCVT